MHLVGSFQSGSKEWMECLTVLDSLPMLPTCFQVSAKLCLSLPMLPFKTTTTTPMNVPYQVVRNEYDVWMNKPWTRHPHT